MISVRMELSGFKELNTALKKLPERAEKRVLQNATMAAIRLGAKDVKAAAPRGENPRSVSSQTYGSLLRNIRVSRVAGARPGGKGAQIHTGDAFWGRFLEYGWDARGRGERGSRHVPAKPWFFEAYSTAVDAMLERLRERITLGIEREWDKIVK